MKISKKDVEHVAKLSYLSFNEEEKESFSKELSSIINYVEKLSQINTEDIEPTAHLLPLKNVVRKDKVEKVDLTEKALSLAPAREGNYYKVLSIIGGE